MQSEPKTAPRIEPSRAMAIANWFLARNWAEPEKPHCDQMKLYKLTFYAHGWYLGNHGNGLFPEDVEAWPHGPVVCGMYPEFNRFGGGEITEFGRHLEISETGGVDLATPTKALSDHIHGFLGKIWNVYGDKTGIQLSNMTHREGEPWTIVAERYGYNLAIKPIIPNEIIESCFARKMAESR